MKKLKIILLFSLVSLCTIRIFLSTSNLSSYYKEKKMSIKGVIVNINYKDDYVVFDIKANKKYRANYNLNKKMFSYEIGDIIEVDGLVYEPSNTTVFNLFDYRKYLLSKKINYLIKVSDVKKIGSSINPLYGLKNFMIKRISEFKSKNYLMTFLLGDNTYVNKNSKENYQMLGISHLFAISGMHVGTFITILNFILSKIKRKKVIINSFLVLFLFLTNFSESLMRCVTFILLKDLFKRLGLVINNVLTLIYTVLLLVIINPYLIYNIGFCFSVSITFFILVYASNKKNEEKYFKSLIKCSVIASLASIPILSMNFFKFNLLTPLFNLIFVPLVSIIIFPFSLITFVFPFLDNLLLMFLNIMEFIANCLSKINLFNMTLGKPSVLVIILYYLFLYFGINKDKRFLFAYLIILILNINMRYFIFNPEVTFLDVGQGDCNIIILPYRKTIVVDTGGKLMANSSVAKSKIIPYLNSRGINKIDYLILTHGDFDHMGEAINLVENFKVEKVIFNCGDYNNLEKKLIKILDKKKIKHYTCINELNLNNNKLYFLNTKEYDNENDNSNVIYTELNNYKFIFTGDASTLTEKEILDEYNLFNIDVLKVGHHGSKTSSSKEFINTINPKYSIVSVGKNNRYGHPNKEVLENLNESKIYRTDIDGSIMFKIKNNKLKIETCSP